MHGHPQQLGGRRFAVFGTGRLARAVIEEFQERGAHAECIGAAEIDKRLRHSQFECFLAVAEEHDANLRAALHASKHAPDLPVVVRAFDPELAEEVERKRKGDSFRVRGAYSVAHLAAPDFVAAALLGDDEGNEVTLRLADQYVNVCRARVRAAPRRGTAQLAGRTPAQVFARHRCQLLARRMPGDPWGRPGADPLRDGEEILLGGRLHDVLDVARRQSRRERPRMRHPAPPERRRHPLRSAWWGVTEAWSYASTQSMRVLLVLLALVSAAVMTAPANGLTGRFQLWVLTALGNPDPDQHPPDELHAIVGGVGLLAGGVALGLGISLMSAYFIDRRLQDAMHRRARRLRRHVIVVGIDDVGLRVAQLLDSLGVPCAVLDTTSETEQEARRRGRRLERAPVIPGELETGLRAAGVHRALSVIASSDDNLLNVEACLRARRDGPPQVRTIARIFDDDEALHGARAFGVDVPLTAAGSAATAFVEAAASEESLRTFDPDGLAMAALRWPSGHPVGRRQMADWHEKGVRLLALWRANEGVRAPAAEVAGIADDEAAMLAGPHEAIDEVLEQLRRRAA
jgi:Trk K+ transport system NAD-binding subunit